MLGTLKAALEVRQVMLEPGALTATVDGFNEVRDGLPVLTRIVVRYRLRVPAEQRATADRALAKHQDKCPTAASLRGAVDVSWTADVTET